MEMFSNVNKKDCGFADEIVAYIYDELAGVERREFEKHLTVCAACTDEFAAVAGARYAVFEWRKEEFAPLSTPEIVIPFEPLSSELEENAPSGILGGVWALFGSTGSRVAFAAAVLACAGLGLGIKYFGGGDPQPSANINKPVLIAEQTPAAETTIVSGPQRTVSIANEEILSGTKLQHGAMPLKPVDIHGPRTERRLIAGNDAPKNYVPVRMPAPKSRNVPMLSSYDDDDDRSLRLADLFDEEVGAS
jgi:hypothetical protein